MKMNKKKTSRTAKAWYLNRKLPRPRTVRSPNPGSLQDLRRFCRRLMRTAAADDRNRLRLIIAHLEEKDVLGEYELAMALERMAKFQGRWSRKARK